MAESSEAPLIPLLVEGSGRDGTTLMMQLLGTAAEIAFDRSYPYEQRYFSYLLAWARLPTLEDWEAEGWDLDSLAHPGDLTRAGSIGPLPWRDRTLIAGTGDREFWRDAFDPAWTAFSTRARAAIRSQLGDPDLELRYYAQKSADSWALPLDRFPDLRLVCLLRDPRDTWISSVAFHRRRASEGDAFLPVEPNGSVEEVLDKFLNDQKHRLRWLQTAAKDLDAPVVRFENLVADLPREAERLGDWLGVRLDAEAVLRRRGEFSGHITAGSAERSAARWKDEMSDELAHRFGEAMGTELSELGYEV